MLCLICIPLRRSLGPTNTPLHTPRLLPSGGSSRCADVPITEASADMVSRLYVHRGRPAPTSGATRPRTPCSVHSWSLVFYSGTDLHRSNLPVSGYRPMCLPCLRASALWAPCRSIPVLLWVSCGPAVPPRSDPPVWFRGQCPCRDVVRLCLFNALSAHNCPAVV